jgi:hypothetical protein
VKSGIQQFFLTSTFVLALVPLPGQAGTIDYTYSFTLVGSGDVTSTGVLTTTALTNNEYTITGINGTRSVNGVSQSIAGLIPAGGFDGNDDLLFPNSPFLDGNGFSFTLNGGGGDDGQGDVNVYYDSTVGQYTESSNKVAYGSFSISPATVVPEPVPPVFAVVAVVVGISFWRRKRSERSLPVQRNDTAVQQNRVA